TRRVGPVPGAGVGDTTVLDARMGGTPFLGSLVPILGRDAGLAVAGHLGCYADVDLGVFVVVVPRMVDLAVVGVEIKLGRVVAVVAGDAEVVVLSLLDRQLHRFSILGVVGLGDVLRARSMTVLALVALQVGCLGFGPPARVVFEPGGVTGDAFRVV